MYKCYFMQLCCRISKLKSFLIDPVYLFVKTYTSDDISVAGKHKL